MFYCFGKLLGFTDVLHVHMLRDTLEWFAGIEHLSHTHVYTRAHTHTAS